MTFFFHALSIAQDIFYFLEFCETDLYILFYNYKCLQSIVQYVYSICELNSPQNLDF